MKLKTYIVDSFTNQPFQGNPAGVCLLESALDESLMLLIAKELGLSETAFVQKTSGSTYSIRFFSPKMEIPLCGHATLAASKVVFASDSSITHLQFSTIENLLLPISQSGTYICMQFPIYDTEPAIAPSALLSAMGLNQPTNCAYNKETNMLLLEINDSAVLRKLQPNFEALIQSHQGINGVLVTALSKNEHYDFESRYFWPWSGTNEDPVTGSTHTFLAKYWSERLGKTKMFSFQCSERSGFMEVELIDDQKMIITSTAQIIFEGNLMV